MGCDEASSRCSDEIASARDAPLVGEVLATVRARAASDVTAVIATCEMGFAFMVAKPVCFPEAGEIWGGTPQRMLSVPRQKDSTKAILQRVSDASGRG